MRPLLPLGWISARLSLLARGILYGPGAGNTIGILGLFLTCVLGGAVSGATTRTFAGILAGARMFRRCLGGVALGARRIGVEWRRVQTPHGATEQARKGRCENHGILSTHDVTFSFCLSSHLNRDLNHGGAQQTRQERAAQLSPSNE
jgi:hypothetical protein